MRIVTVTVLIGLTLSALLGFGLYRSITDQLVERRIVSAQAEAARATQLAQESFRAVAETDIASLNNTAAKTVLLIASPASERSRDVVLLPALDNMRPPDESLRPLSSSAVRQNDVPEELRQSLSLDPSYQQVMLTELDLDDGGSVATVAVGARISVAQAGEYDLYFFFPMESEAAMLSVVARALLTGLVGLVLLIAGISALATRLAVRPIRRAAAASQRLASGDLDQRLSTAGAHDIAALAHSFNIMADTLQTQIRQLEDLSAVQQRFVSDVSHELRTPLTTVRMAGALLYDARDQLPAELLRPTELLHSEIDRFHDLLADLLEISRFDAGAAVLDLEPWDLRDVVQREVSDLAGLAERHGTPIAVKSDPEPCMAPMDRRRVSRIIRNLVANAIEHGERRPVTVTVDRGDAAVSVAVADQGIGLSEEHMERVFDRFWRADPSRSRIIGGSGLGLAIAMEDARLHGGTLSVSGAPGEGATFVLTLPTSPRTEEDA